MALTNFTNLRYLKTTNNQIQSFLFLFISVSFLTLELIYPSELNLQYSKISGRNLIWILDKGQYPRIQARGVNSVIVKVLKRQTFSHFFEKALFNQVTVYNLDFLNDGKIKLIQFYVVSFLAPY